MSQLVGLFISQLVGQLVGKLVHGTLRWPVKQSVGLSDDQFDFWSVSQLIDQLVVWSVGQ